MKKWQTRRQLRQKVSLQAFTAVSGSSFAKECWTDTNACWETLCESFTLEKGVAPGWISSLKFCCRYRKPKRCVAFMLITMELILIPNCGLLDLHSNDTNGLKNYSQNKSKSYKYNCYKNNKQSQSVIH